MHSERRFLRSLFMPGAVMLALVMLVGCSMQRTVLDSSAAESYGDPDSELEFYDTLEEKRVVTNHDALHALLLFDDEPHPPEDFEGRLLRARQRGWVKPDRDLAPNESARMGMIAVAACEILDIKGGVTMRVLKSSQRYATRELVYLQMIPRRTENQSMSGLEFLDLLGRMQEWRDMTEPVREPEVPPLRLPAEDEDEDENAIDEPQEDAADAGE